MASGCRDCKRCTRSPIAKFMWGLIYLGSFGIIYFAEKLLNAGRKGCPQCGHPLAWHSRDASGRFKD